MNPVDSSKDANSRVGDVVKEALRVRERWLDQNAEEAKAEERLKDWEASKPFWKPWFRGHEKANWKLRPKLFRDTECKVEDLFEFEEELRAEFKRRGSQLAEGLTLPAYQDDWGWYSLMQHYGAPTRLLDWSDGALIALYFAVRDRPKDKNQDGACIWMLDPYRLNRLSFYPPDNWPGVALPDWPAAKQYLPELFGDTNSTFAATCTPSSPIERFTRIVSRCPSSSQWPKKAESLATSTVSS